MPGSIGTAVCIGGILHASAVTVSVRRAISPAPPSNAEGACAKRSCVSIKLLGDRPRRTSGPARSVTSADASRVTRIVNLLNRASPSRTRALSTGPSLMVGENVGVVTQAT